MSVGVPWYTAAGKPYMFGWTEPGVIEAAELATLSLRRLTFWLFSRGG